MILLPEETFLAADTPFIPLDRGDCWTCAAGIPGENCSLGVVTEIPDPVTHYFDGPGIEAPSFYDVLYGELHFLPFYKYDDGLIFQDQLHEVCLWNTTTNEATFTEIQTEQPEGTGLDLSLDPLPAFGAREGTIYVYAEGPAETHATYHILNSIREIVFEVHAQRLIILPELPNWREGFQLKYEFETVLNTNRFLVEQRRPLQQKPIRTPRFDLLVDEVALQTVRNLLVFGDAKNFLVPIVSEVCHLSATGSTFLQCSNDISGYWNLLNLCDNVILFDSVTFKADRALGITGADPETGQIALDRELQGTVDTTRTVAFPGVICTNQEHKEDMLSDRISEISLEFREFASGQQPDMADLPTLPTYFPLENPNWQSPPDVQFESVQQFLKYPGTAESMYRWPSRQPFLFDAEYGPMGKTTEKALLDFFCAAQGRLRGFWIRGNRPDFTVAQRILADDGGIKVHDNSFGYVFDPDDPTPIYLRDKYGNVYDRKILTANVVEPGILLLGIDQNLGIELEPEDVIIVGRRYYVRFKRDALELDFVTNDTARTDISFYELINEGE